MSYVPLGCIGCLVGLAGDECPPDPANGQPRIMYEGDCRTEAEINDIVRMKEHGKTVDTFDSGPSATTVLLVAAGSLAALGLGYVLLTR